MGSPYGVVTDFLAWDILVTQMELQSRCYIHIQTDDTRKGIDSLIPRPIGWLVQVIFFYKDWFGFKKPTKVDMKLNLKKKKPIWISIMYFFKIVWLYSKHVSTFSFMSCWFVFWIKQQPGMIAFVRNLLLLLDFFIKKHYEYLSKNKAKNSFDEWNYSWCDLRVSLIDTDCNWCN